jgi:hypothetical protein
MQVRRFELRDEIGLLCGGSGIAHERCPSHATRGFDPAHPALGKPCVPKRDRRDKPGDD